MGLKDRVMPLKVTVVTLLTQTRAYLNWLAKVLWIRWHCRREEKQANISTSYLFLNINGWRHTCGIMCFTHHVFYTRASSHNDGVVKVWALWKRTKKAWLKEKKAISVNVTVKTSPSEQVWYLLFSWYKCRSRPGTPTTSPEDNPGSVSSRN